MLRVWALELFRVMFNPNRPYTIKAANPLNPRSSEIQDQIEARVPRSRPKKSSRPSTQSHRAGIPKWVLWQQPQQMMTILVPICCLVLSREWWNGNLQLSLYLLQ